jgi:hypothetical protein
LARPPDKAQIAVIPTHSRVWYKRRIARQSDMMRGRTGEDQFMDLRRTMLIAVGLLPFAVAPAAAQFQPAPGAQQGSACAAEFIKLRDEATKRAGLIRDASKRKVAPVEACKLFNSFSAAEDKMLKYAETNSVWCGIPPEIIAQIKQQHAKTTEYRTRICQAAAQPPQPRGPTLSDTLTAPVTDAGNIRTGRGTFDTLTGSPLGAK